MTDTIKYNHNKKSLKMITEIEIDFMPEYLEIIKEVLVTGFYEFSALDDYILDDETIIYCSLSELEGFNILVEDEMAEYRTWTKGRMFDNIVEQLKAEGLI